MSSGRGRAASASRRGPVVGVAQAGQQPVGDRVHPHVLEHRVQVAGEKGAGVGPDLAGEVGGERPAQVVQRPVGERHPHERVVGGRGGRQRDR